ncbi:MAG: hypothetical protein F9B45_03770 [Phycisphaera sp. RhM]|nr:hypothetical protein [Phycisphaera sp. RhM]
MTGSNRKSSVAHGSETNARKFARNLTVTLYGLVFVASAFSVTRWQLVDDRGLLFVHMLLAYLQSANFIQPTKTVVPLVGQYLFCGSTLLATLNHTRR